MPVLSPATLRKRLEKEVAALFRKAPAAKDGANGNRSVPGVVLEGRRRRAEARILDALVSRGSDTVPRTLLQESQRLIRSWSEAGYADGFEPVERFENQRAQEHAIVVAQQSGDPEKFLDALEQDYRLKLFEKYSKAELRGVQTSHRLGQDLATIFVPLHLQPSLVFEESGLERLTLGQREAVPSTLKQHRHTLIIGSPGSGKTTLVAYLATRAARGHNLAEFGWHEETLPFVIAVRELASARLTPASLAKNTGCDIGVARRALIGSRTVLLVDGLDEAPEVLHTQLVDSIRHFVKEYPEARVVTTSRPAGAPGEVEKSLPGLKPFRIVDLQRHEADDFIDRWCLAAELSLRNDPAEARKEAERAASDLKRRLEESYSVQKIAVTPLLLNILCIVHRFLGRRIPEHRVTLYERCTDALLYEWDRAKFPEGSAVGELDAPAKRRLLMGVARRIHEEHAAELEESEVRKHFESKLPDLGRPASDAQNILAEIRDRSGLLVERRPGYFAFSHMTFQEYFCALDFVDRKQIAELVGHFEDRWWHEVIVLAAGAPGAGPGSVAKGLLAKKKPAAIFLAAQSLETAPETPLTIRERVEKALARFVPPETIEGALDLRLLGPVAAPILMRALNFGNLAEPAKTLWSLGYMDYAPSVPTLARFVGDPRPAGPSFPTDTVGSLSLFLLSLQATNLDIARLALLSVVGRETAEHVQNTRSLVARRGIMGLGSKVRPGYSEIIDILDAALKAARREKRQPTPARSTAGKRANRKEPGLEGRRS